MKNNSEKAAPTFMTPEKNGTDNYIFNFREFNKSAISYSYVTTFSVQSKKVSKIHLLSI